MVCYALAIIALLFLLLRVFCVCDCLFACSVCCYCWLLSLCLFCVCAYCVCYMFVCGVVVLLLLRLFACLFHCLFLLLCLLVAVVYI